MSHRLLACVGVVAMVGATVWLTALANAQTTAQAPKPAARGWTAPRTPDGQPDLQGFWTNTTYVPLERPKNVTKEFYTTEEAAEAIKRAAVSEAEQTVLERPLTSTTTSVSSGWTAARGRSRPTCGRPSSWIQRMDDFLP